MEREINDEVVFLQQWIKSQWWRCLRENKKELKMRYILCYVSSHNEFNLFINILSYIPHFFQFFFHPHKKSLLFLYCILLLAQLELKEKIQKGELNSGVLQSLRYFDNMFFYRTQIKPRPNVLERRLRDKSIDV